MCVALVAIPLTSLTQLTVVMGSFLPASCVEGLHIETSCAHVAMSRPLQAEFLTCSGTLGNETAGGRVDLEGFNMRVWFAGAKNERGIVSVLARRGWLGR